MSEELDSGFQGNNFYCLFQARRIFESNPENWFARVYLNPMEMSCREEWSRFLDMGSDLLVRIDSVLETRDILMNDSDKVRDLLMKGNFKQAGELETELDLPNRTQQLWQTLGPLLLEAAWMMEQNGIDPTSIGGWGDTDLIVYQEYKNERSEHTPSSIS